VADCFRGSFLQLEMHDHQQWTAVYVGSLAARMTTTGDGDGWNRQCSGCRPSRKDTVTPDRAGMYQSTEVSCQSPDVDGSHNIILLFFAS